jgi:hypothetical protein
MREKIVVVVVYRKLCYEILNNNKFFVFLLLVCVCVVFEKKSKYFLENYVRVKKIAKNNTTLKLYLLFK